MHKRLHKMLSLVMAGLLFLTSTFTNVGQSYAAESLQNGDVYESTYAIAELGTPGGYQYTAEEAEDGITFNYSAQYAEVKYAIPEDVVKAGLKGYRVSVSSKENLGLKIYSAEGQAAVGYWVDSLDFDGSVVPTEIGFMNCSDEEKSFTFSSVTFITERELGVEAPADEPGDDPADEPGDAPVVEPENPEPVDPKPVEPETPAEVTELVFNENISFVNRWNSSQAVGKELTFGGQYNEFVLDLGQTIDAANVESVTVAFAEQNEDVSVKLYGEGFSENFVEYHNTGKTEYTFDKQFDGNLRYVGIMSILEGEEAYPYTVTVSSITVKVNNKVVEPEEPATKPGLDEYTELSFADRWTGTPAASTTLSFDDRYQEYVVDLGKTYSTSEVNEVSVAVKDQGNLICVKFYDSGMNEMQPNYDLIGESVYSIPTKYDGDLRYIGIMSLPDPADSEYPYSVTVEKISVSYTPTVYEETWKFGPDELSFVNNWTGETAESTTLSYSQEWEEYTFTLPKSVRADKIKSLNVKVKDQGLVLCFKLYSGSTEVAPFYDQVGRTEYGLSYGGDEEITAIAVMAMNKQDDVFPASVTIEEIAMVIDTTPETEPPVEKGVEYDIVNLRDEMTAVLGEDFIVGCAISSAEFADSMEMELVTKHFNGVTLGNELKPDSMLRSNAEKVMVEVGGEEILFPVLNFSTPDRYLDYFVNWNNEHPDKKIRIRGHVLVWHSQTPDFFFHEDYDESKPFVTPDVMNLRLEAYIRAVCEHYTSEGSKYKELFYGWDVVNEAISDGSGTYRNANESSTWWKVYGSPEFINNAFVYANKYMPADIALFYNDYNAYQPNKSKGIIKLIENVKATPGSRIDGMGMQAHYFCEDNNPTMEAVKKAAKAYGELVDQVQFTEIDFKGSTGPKDEQLAKRYKDLYDTVRRLINEGTNVTGFTIWGVVDKHSWLQQQSNVGGGSTTNSKQYPLLFDNNYKAKPAFYALCNAGELDPEIKNISVLQLAGDDFSTGETYSFATDNGKVEFTPMWDATGVKVKVNVTDATVDDTDAIALYVANGDINKVTVARSAATATADGYEAVLEIALGSEVGTFKLDVTVTDGTKTFAFNDTKLTQDISTKFYASAVKKPFVAVSKGTVKVDGLGDDAAWEKAENVPLTINLGADVKANAKLLWDEEYLYVLMDVTDAVLNSDAKEAHEQDSVEVFIDENNEKSSGYQDDDKQYRINYKNVQSFNGTKCNEDNILSAAVLTEEGYIVEAAFRWTDIEAKAGTKIGLELQINDANANGKRSGTLSWADNSGNGWSSTEVFGTVVLAEGEEPAPAVKNGIVETEEGLYYFVNDVKTYAGLIEIDGNFYYVAGGGAVARGNYYVSHANGIMANGHYIFDEVTGKMLLNGICNVYGEDRYYVDGDLAKGAGVVNVAGKLYFVDADGKIVKDAAVEVTEAGILGAGTYTADSKGVILLEGLVTLNGVTSYFANNRRAHRAGLVEADGAYYYVIENGALATGFVTVKSTNGLKPFGVYEFDADGKMIIKNGLVDEEGDTYYYVDGKRTYAGLVEVDGDFYYIAGDCKAVKGRSYFITHTNGLIEKSRHAQFDADGKMIK